MANDPVVPAAAVGKTPAAGTASSPVNVNFTGPNAMGVLNDLPPMVDSAAPLIVTNGTNQNKLGIQAGASPKSHG